MTATPLRVALVAVLALGGAGRAASAQTTGAEPPVTASDTDTILVGGQLDRLGGLSGWAGSIDWLRATPGGPIYTAGVAEYRVGDSRWAVGRVGAVARPSARTTIGGGATLGRGDTNGVGFHYRAYRGELTHRLHRRMTVVVSDEFLDVAGTRGNLVKTGGALLVSARATASLSYAASTSGNLNTRFAFGRLDVSAGRLGLFGGGATGRTTPEVVDLGFGRRAAPQPLRQLFVGATVPLPGSRVTVAIDHLTLGAASRYTVTLTVGVPVGS